jgi:hypothetical protein
MAQYDYVNQCWIVDGVIEPCGHVVDCDCYGITDVPETLVKPNTLKVTYTFKTRKPKGPNTGIKPVNGNRLALRLN